MHETAVLLSTLLLLGLTIELDILEIPEDHLRPRISLSLFAIASIIVLNSITVKTLLFPASKVILFAAQLVYLFVRFDVYQTGVLRSIFVFLLVILKGDVCKKNIGDRARRAGRNYAYRNRERVLIKHCWKGCLKE